MPRHAKKRRRSTKKRSRKGRKVTKKLIRRATGRAGRSLIRGSIKMHHFIDRGQTINMSVGTASNSSGTYTVSWAAPTTGVQSVVTSANIQLLSWSFNILQYSQVWNANRNNYSFAKMGKVNLRFKSSQSVLSGGSSSVIPNLLGLSLLHNSNIPLEYAASGNASAATSFSGAITTEPGAFAYMMSLYGTFEDDPDTKKKPFMTGDRVNSHAFTRSPQNAVPQFTNTSTSGGVILTPSNWPMNYTFKKAGKMSITQADLFYYRPIVFMFPPSTATASVSFEYAVEWTVEFWLVDPN